MHMARELAGIKTRELWARLFQAPSLDRFLAENADACDMPSFGDYLLSLCEARGMKPDQVASSAGIERSFGYRLFSGTRNPSRDTVLQLAFGFGLSVEEAQQLLKVAHVSALHPKVKRDAVIAYCLNDHRSFMDAQTALYECGLPLMGGKKNA